MSISAKEAYEIGSSPQFEVDLVSLGPWTTYSLMTDPKHMVFVLSRYKFVAKMLDGKASAMEVGCGDGFGAPIIAQAVKQLHCFDWEQRHIDANPKRLKHLKNVSWQQADFVKSPPKLKVDAAYSVDVIEHLEPSQETAFMEGILRCLTPNGVLITGTPNITAEQYATEHSKVQHINLKSMKTLKELHERYFHHVFMFGMNDEVLHTGYAPMCHYIWAVACGLKKSW